MSVTCSTLLLISRAGSKIQRKRLTRTTFLCNLCVREVMANVVVVDGGQCIFYILYNVNFDKISSAAKPVVAFPSLNVFCSNVTRCDT